MFNDLTALQDDLNTLINPNWRNELTPDHFTTQVVDELSELLGSGVEYKWWKHIDPDKFDEHNFKIELIDVVFFTLCKIMVDDRTQTGQIETMPEQILLDTNKINYSAFINVLQIIMSSELFDGDDVIGYILSSARMSHEEASAYYVTKFVLNKFRQDSGYKSGEYVKVVDGTEDNERLRVLVLDFLDDSGVTLLELVEDTVSHFYKHV
jgi:hypothetical protein